MSIVYANGRSFRVRNEIIDLCMRVDTGDLDTFTFWEKVMNMTLTEDESTWINIIMNE